MKEKGKGTEAEPEADLVQEAELEAGQEVEDQLRQGETEIVIGGVEVGVGLRRNEEEAEIVVEVEIEAESVVEAETVIETGIK